MQRANLIQMFFDQVICNQQFHLLDEMITDDVVCIAPQAVEMGRAAVRQTFEHSAKAFASLQMMVQFAAEHDNRVVARVCMRGQQRHVYAGIRSTGRRIALPCVYVFELRNDKICGIEVYYDLQLLASQISNREVWSAR